VRGPLLSGDDLKLARRTFKHNRLQEASVKLTERVAGRASQCRMEVQPCQSHRDRRSTCFGNSAVTETRKLDAIMVSDVVGYSRLTGADEDRILARLRALRSDLIVPTIAVHHGRVVKRTGDGEIVEFRSVVDAVRCALEAQNAMVERTEDRRIQFRVGIHIGDVVEESDGDLMGDDLNVAARVEGWPSPARSASPNKAYWQVKGRLDLKVTDLGNTQLKNIAQPVHIYSSEVGEPIEARPTPAASPGRPGAPRLSLVVMPFANIGGDPEQEYFADGVTESPTTDLSRISGSFVIARPPT
jgi:adenylate cyclase